MYHKYPGVLFGFVLERRGNVTNRAVWDSQKDAKQWTAQLCTTLQMAQIVQREVCLDAHGLSKINNPAENLCISIVCVIMIIVIVILIIVIVFSVIIIIVIIFIMGGYHLLQLWKMPDKYQQALHMI